MEKTWRERDCDMSIQKSVSDLVGATPMLLLDNLAHDKALDAIIIAKCECFNPTGSIKDRAARSMLDRAEARGDLKPGAVIVEPTSGNTGIALAALGIARGYRVLLVMPETMSVERRNLLKAYGAELVLTQGGKGMGGAIERAKEITMHTPNAYMPSQFDNSDNAQAHYETTGPEIWCDTGGRIDVLVAGVGTGGTISGTARYLKEQNPNVYIVAVEPEDSPVLSGGKAGPHGIQGIGAGFVPAVLDRKIIDEIVCVKTPDAYDVARSLARREGILSGISSGAAVWAAMQVAKRPEFKGKTIVAILPDTGERYLSTPLFDE